MKYWVYKESRILGPFEKEAVSGFPGLDSGTLVCAGDPVGGSWMPAGEFADLSGVAAGGVGPLDDLPSSVGLLDQLQIDCAGLIGDDEFPGAFAEELFQDASLKQGFGDALSTRARDKISELTAQLEVMSRQVLELEAGKTDLTRRLAEKDLELRSHGDAIAPADPAAVVPEEAPPLAELSQAPPPPPVLFEPPPAPAPEPVAAPKTLSFDKPKSFQIVPTVRSFKILGADEDVPEAAPSSVAEFKVEPVIETPAPGAAAPESVAAVPEPPQPAEPVVPEPAFVPVPVMELVTPPFALPERPQPSIPTPSFPPPNTLNLLQPVPDLASAELVGPPSTASEGADAVAARFAKPELAPATGAAKRQGRSNKTFLIGGGALVTVLMILGVIFMRQPKEDLKQMTTLDDGKAPIGLPADDGDAASPRIAKPKLAETSPAAAPLAPPPGPSAEHLAAIALVKDFPLDGSRGTIGRWLQYSYTASPDAGAEEWNASSTGDKTVLVEYRLVSSAAEGKGALYLFEVDPNGLVRGKNPEARQMLAGGPPPEAPRAKKKTPKKAGPKRAAKRPAAVEESKEVPLLPLPDSGELRPPAEDDGTFGSDTVNPGI